MVSHRAKTTCSYFEIQNCDDIEFTQIFVHDLRRFQDLRVNLLRISFCRNFVTKRPNFFAVALQFCRADVVNCSQDCLVSNTFWLTETKLRNVGGFQRRLCDYFDMKFPTKCSKFWRWRSKGGNLKKKNLQKFQNILKTRWQNRLQLVAVQWDTLRFRQDSLPINHNAVLDKQWRIQKASSFVEPPVSRKCDFGYCSQVTNIV